MSDIKGIDISYANGAFDLQAAKRQGAEFVIIRMGYGGDYSDQDDDRYAENVRKCEQAGMPYGVYLYSYALNTAQAQSEAQHALRLLKQVGSSFKHGVWFDMEDADGYKARKGMPSKSVLVDICHTFCAAVSAAGYAVGVYASASWLKNQLAALTNWPKWVAHWGVSAPGYTDGVVLWQYACPPGDKASPTAYDWNRTVKDFVQTGGNILSRILKTGQNQITNPYKSGSHDGIDIVKNYNQLDTIVAHSAGTVTYLQRGYGNAPGSGGDASYGNLVKIKHANGYYTLYAHLDVVASGLQVGSVVTKGQTVGVMGNSGNSYGAHLHFEVRDKNDSRINPTAYINADLPGLKTETEEEIDMTKEQVEALIDTRAAKIAKAQITAHFDAMRGTKCPDWARPYIEEAIKRGMITGDGKTATTPDNVRPEAYIKRDEAAKMFLEAEKSR